MSNLLLLGQGAMGGYWRVADNKLADLLNYIDNEINQGRGKPDWDTAEVKGVRDEISGIYTTNCVSSG